MGNALCILGRTLIRAFSIRLSNNGYSTVHTGPGDSSPRYIRWKNTVYSLSDDSLFLTTAGIPILQKSKTYKVSFDTMAQMEVKHGMFGRTLGYGEINIVFDDSRLAKLSYIQDYDGFVEHIEAHADLPGLPEQESDTDDTQD